jgi:hypothetical protein
MLLFPEHLRQFFVQQALSAVQLEVQTVNLLRRVLLLQTLEQLKRRFVQQVLSIIHLGVQAAHLRRLALLCQTQEPLQQLFVQQEPSVIHRVIQAAQLHRQALLQQAPEPQQQLFVQQAPSVTHWGAQAAHLLLQVPLCPIPEHQKQVSVPRVHTPKTVAKALVFPVRLGRFQPLNEQHVLNLILTVVPVRFLLMAQLRVTIAQQEVSSLYLLRQNVLPLLQVPM